MNHSDWQKDYPEQGAPEALEANENSSLSQMLRLIAPASRVLEFGCATGYFSSLLTRKGCRVTGLEINEHAAEQARRYCEKVIVADLDTTPLASVLGAETFDVATFGDVLEHLRDPWKLLRQIHQHLTPNGIVVISIPNIAHGAIRLALLQGRFAYQPLGILDNTHLRFFTRATLVEMLEETGWHVETMNRTTCSMTEPSDLLPAFDADAVPKGLLRTIRRDPDAETLQFIVRARPQTPADPRGAVAMPALRPLKFRDRLRQWALTL